MYYLIHYSIAPCDKFTIQALNDLGVKYTVSHGYKNGRGGFVAFYIEDNDSRIGRIRVEFPENAENSNQEGTLQENLDSRIINTIYFPKYTEKERCEGSWLDVRCITAKLDPANYEDIYRASCIFDRSRIGKDIGHHKVQINPLEIRRTFKWGNSQFFSGAIAVGGLFCDDRAVSIMEHADLKGLQYGPVLKWRTGVPIPNVHQVLPNHVIPNGVFAPIRDMESYTCEMCGMQMLRISGKKFLYGIRDNFLNPEVDFYKTLPLFLDYSSKRHSGGKIHYIISQRAYQVLKKNRMCRGVEFTPLTLMP